MAYSKIVTIDINNAYVHGSNVDFPILITENKLKNSPYNIFSTARADGLDIKFTLQDGVTVLKREVVVFDPINFKMEIWVKIPLLSASSVNSIVCFYGDHSINLPNDMGTWNSSYKMVLHLQTDLGISTFLDSTDNANDGFNGGYSPATGTSGLWGTSGTSALNTADNTRQYIDFPSTVALSTSYTLSAWVKYPVNLNISGSGYTTLFRSQTLGDQVTLPIGGSGELGSFLSSFSGSGYFVNGDSNWHLLHAVVSVSGTNFYIDGSLVGSNGVTAISYVGGLLSIGNFPQELGDSHQAWGTFDEVRLEHTIRSDAWRNTEYLTAFNQATLYSLSNFEEGDIIYSFAGPILGYLKVSKNSTLKADEFRIYSGQKDLQEYSEFFRGLLR